VNNRGKYGNVLALVKLAEKEGLLFSHKATLMNSDFYDFSLNLDENTKPKQAYFLSVEIPNVGGGHALGVYKSQNHEVHFFDPNIGEYKIKDIAQFFREYKALVAQTMQWKYGGVTGYCVYRLNRLG